MSGDQLCIVYGLPIALSALGPARAGVLATIDRSIARAYVHPMRLLTIAPIDRAHLNVEYLPPALPAVLASEQAHPLGGHEDDQRRIGRRPDRAHRMSAQLLPDPEPAPDPARVAEQRDSVICADKQQTCFSHCVLTLGCELGAISRELCGFQPPFDRIGTRETRSAIGCPLGESEICNSTRAFVRKVEPAISP